jgi:alanine racemase
VSPYVDPATASAVIDLDAFATNIETLRRHVAPAAVMVVVKAEAYGHGMIECARVAREAGAEWLGVATPEEALALREAGDTGRVLAWLYGPDTDLAPLVAADVDISAQSPEQIARISTAAGITERRARVHLKIDTGLSRNGATAATWPDLCRAARHAEQVGALDVVSVWSHFASADEPGAASVGEQQAAYEAACVQAYDAGLTPTIRHLSNSAGALLLPQARYDLVRIGIAAYGIEPDVGIAALAGVRLRPVMRLRARLVNVKIIDSGAGVSYGHTWHASKPTAVGLVPLGYGDGIPRHAGNTAEVFWAGRRAPIRGRVCMDQFVVELGDHHVQAGEGEEVILFGTGDHGEPTAADRADWCGTIGYEIVTRIGVRIPRVYTRTPIQDGDHG